ncbi:MAG: hypothetical protein HGA39_09430 [Coriobacteriia bacterium]|nr:hypothetical protein [Coriobacteriia bacterium]
MELTITCPVDGPVNVSIEDIDSVVLRESECADVMFVCPHCGSEISVTGVVPSFLLSAIQAIAEETEDPGRSRCDLSAAVGVRRTSPSVSVERDEVIEAYCEYFRRQLAHVDCVHDALAEIGTPTR